MTLEITYKRGSAPDGEPHDALVQFGGARLRADAVEGGLYLAHVETPEELQRTGIASALFARLHQETMLNMSKATVMAWAKADRVPAYRVGRSWTGSGRNSWPGSNPPARPRGPARG